MACFASGNYAFLFAGLSLLCTPLLADEMVSAAQSTTGSAAATTLAEPASAAAITLDNGKSRVVRLTEAQLPKGLTADERKSKDS